MKMKSVVFRSVSLFAGIMLLLFLLKGTDVHSISGLLLHIGYLSIPVVLLFLLGSMFDTLAWERLLPQKSPKISFLKLLQVHFAGESFYRFIPAGAVIGETVKIHLLKRHSAFSYPEIISSLVLRKFFMGFAQALYIGLAVVCGIIFNQAVVSGQLAAISAILAGGLLILVSLMGYFLMKGNLCRLFFQFLTKLPVKRMQNLLSRHEGSFAQMDELIKRSLSQQRSASLAAFFFFFLGWMSELVETYLILVALGTTLSIANIMLFEPVVSLLRSIVFFLPGGFGVMDVGYVSALQSFGADDAPAIAAAFIIVKRAKELIWVIIGLVLTLLLGGKVDRNYLSHLQAAAAGKTA